MINLLHKIVQKMASKASIVVLYSTAASKEEAERIAAALVEGKLIACCNQVEGVSSIYFWEGKVNQEKEVLMIMKSRESLIPAILHRIKQLHSYKVPELIAMPIVGGSPEYIDWVLDNTLSQ